MNPRVFIHQTSRSVRLAVVGLATVAVASLASLARAEPNPT